jgi:DNA-directed RNA polymerase subunit RPC12/RpoP
MTETLKCPDCSAPLEYPANGGATMRCPYCSSTVILPGAVQAGPAPSPFDTGAGRGPTGGQSVHVAEVIRALRAGNKIEAIRLYRQYFNVDLAAAKNAVEKYASQQQIGVVRSSPTFSRVAPADKAAAAYATRVGLGVAGSIFALVGVIFFFVFFQIRRQVSRVMPPPPTAAFAPPRSDYSNLFKTASGPAAPAAPACAHQVLAFGSEGIGAGNFTDARTVAIDGNGLVYVGEYSDGRIQVFDGKGKFISAFSIGKDQAVLGLTADRHGTLYVVVPSHILRYEGASGKLLGQVDNKVDDDESFWYADAYAAIDGDLYAIGNNRDIVDIGPDGKIKHYLDLAKKVGEDVSFWKLAVIGTGEIFALDRQKGIFKFSPEGRYLNRFGGGSKGHDGPGRLSSPDSIAADGKGRIYVTDSFRAVQVFDSDGNYLDNFGIKDLVFGIAISDQNEIYLCFRNQYSVRKFVLDKP